jgi:hypothetical protein
MIMESVFEISFSGRDNVLFYKVFGSTADHQSWMTNEKHQNCPDLLIIVDLV